MRRTQQNADRQQGRGIRSRLVACVAAVAMLVTSVAAGTAVAAELGGGDAADQTTQNTATLEQQGNKSTANGDATTTPGSGTDDDQGVNEPGTTEGNGDTTGEGDAVGDVSDAGGVEKRVASVPSPQEPGSPSVLALDNGHAMDVPSTSDEVHVKLFDYQTSGKPNVNTNHDLKFGATGAPAEGNGTGLNQYTGWGNGVNQGLVARDLIGGVNGYPQLAGNNNDSLQYLFDPASTAAGVGIKNNGEDVDGLFQVDEDGYYYYDSRYNFASYDDSEGKFKLYDTGRFTDICENSWGNWNCDALTDDDPLPGDSDYGGAFMPFNDLIGNIYMGFSYQNHQWKGYNLAGSKNYSFGMTVETQFYMPKDRQVNGEDMVFEFSGDDDVWVFVDGRLVLDLGGIHDDFGGSINFADGTATVDKVYGETGEQTVKLDNILSQGWGEFGSQHTLKVFYLERGAGGSNCKFRFNLPTISQDSINVGKQITDSNTAGFTNAQFTMKVEVDPNGGDHTDAYTYRGSYAVIDMDTNQVVDTRETADDGTFTIGHNQYASLKPEGDEGFGRETMYRVTELTANNYDKEDYEFSLADTNMVEQGSGADQTDTVGRSTWLNVITDTNFLIVNNRFTATNKYSFTVSKRMTDGQDAGGTEFSLKVTDGRGNPYTGKYFLKNGDVLDENSLTTKNGVIALRAGQSAVIMDVDPGTTFKIEETVPDGYKAPSYACTTDGANTCGDGQADTVTVGKSNPKPTITVTNTLDQLDPPAVSKKIGHDRKSDGSFDGDSYTLALDVTGDTSTTQTQSTTPLDIVLVLDRSGSMADPLGKIDPGEMDTSKTYQIEIETMIGSYYREIEFNASEKEWGYYGGLTGKRWIPVNLSQYDVYSSKMDALKTAVKELIDSTVQSSTEASVQHKIGIVSFAGNASVNEPLTVVDGSTVDGLKSVVDGLDSDGGTQSDDGLLEAAKMLKADDSGAKKVVIFFTDGVPGGSNGGNFDDDVASDAVNNAYDLKRLGASVYSVGVFDDADPTDTEGQFNKYMHAVSSNFPDARVGNNWHGAWHESDDFGNLVLGDRVSEDSRYYLKADDPDGLAQVFQDIYESESSTNGYTNVSIVDWLSDYAQLNEGITWDDEAASDDGFYPVAVQDNLIWLEVTDANGDSVNSESDGYPSYTLWYNPKSKTVRADLGAEPLRDGWTYTLKFKIRPTQKAYDDYAENLRDGKDGYSGTKGDSGTDLYDVKTSSELPGFRSNREAYVEYDANGQSDLKEPYQNPVLQVEDTSITVTKNWDGRIPTGVDKVMVQLNDEDGEVATLEIARPMDGAQSWTGTFDHVAPGHTYTVTETPLTGYGDPTIAYTENDGTVDSLAVETGDVWSDPKTTFAATVTNSPAPKTYDADDHLKLHKQLDGADLDPGMFRFTLEKVSAKDLNGTDIPNAVTLPQHVSVSNGDANGDGTINDDNEEDDSLFDFGTVTFSEPGTYVLKVTESQDKPTAETGRYVFDEHALYVRYTVGQNAETGALDITTREVATSTDENPDPDGLAWQLANIGTDFGDDFADTYLTWHNTYVAPVSSLPLTGGDSTARTLLLAGGGVLLVAGAAWLLSRRRRV